MLVDSSAKSIQLKTDATATTTEPVWSIDIHEVTANALGEVSGSLRVALAGALTGTTPVSIVPAPASGKQRQVLELFVRNVDTVARTFKLIMHGATDYEIFRFTLPAGFQAIYAIRDGWTYFDANGGYSAI